MESLLLRLTSRASGEISEIFTELCGSDLALAHLSWIRISNTKL